MPVQAAAGITLDRVAQVAGEPAAYALADARGGRRVHIPHTGSAETELGLIVGAEAAAKLAAAFGGLDFAVARRWRWPERAARLDAAGKSRSEIAAALGTSERNVYKLLDRAREAGALPPRPRRGYDPAQESLFGDGGA